MKTIFIVALLFVAPQAKDYRSYRDGKSTRIHHEFVSGVHQAVDVVASAPKYPTSRIISGAEAFRGQFPFQAALYVDGNSFCGGTLISSRWVLTVAHCVVGTTSYTVYLGAQDLDNADEEGRIVVETTSKTVHPSYSSVLISNDIALVNLNQGVTLNNLIQAISLASGSEQYEGTIARVSGWGKTSDDDTFVNPQLNYVDLTVISNELCRQTFGSYIRTSNICTQGAGERGICNGDSASPLVDSASGKLIGIASFLSSDGCQSGNPNGFVRISSFFKWISENTDASF